MRWPLILAALAPAAFLGWLTLHQQNRLEALQEALLRADGMLNACEAAASAIIKDAENDKRIDNADLDELRAIVDGLGIVSGSATD